jgi:hypothetical protein
MVGRYSGVSSLITNDVKNTTNRDLMHENLCAKYLKITIGVTVVSNLVGSLGQK